MRGFVDISVGPVTVRLRERHDRCCLHVRNEGEFEPETLAAWALLCGRGGRVLDVGAYTGLFAIAARKMGCDVVAFEPLPENAVRVRENMRTNEVQLDVRQIAVADHSGIRDLWYSTVPNTSAASLVQRRSRRVPVRTVSLDDSGFGPVRAIKIDVERAEPIVLRGAARLLQMHHPALLVEVLGSVEAHDVKAVLAAQNEDGSGYRLQRVLDGRNWLMEYTDA